MANGSGGDMFYKKVYIDEFETPGNICEGGRSLFYRNLDEG